jgi:hypothetical protein
MIEQDLSANAEPPRTQVSRGEVSLDTSHPSLVIPHGQTQAVAQNVKKPKLSEYACTIYEVECYVLDCVRDVIPKAFWGSEANRKVVEKSEPLSSSLQRLSARAVADPYHHRRVTASPIPTLRVCLASCALARFLGPRLRVALHQESLVQGRTGPAAAQYCSRHGQAARAAERVHVLVL